MNATVAHQTPEERPPSRQQSAGHDSSQLIAEPPPIRPPSRTASFRRQMMDQNWKFVPILRHGCLPTGKRMHWRRTESEPGHRPADVKKQLILAKMCLGPNSKKLQWISLLLLRNMRHRGLSCTAFYTRLGSNGYCDLGQARYASDLTTTLFAGTKGTE